MGSGAVTLRSWAGDAELPQLPELDPLRAHVHRGVRPGHRLDEEREAVDPHRRVVGQPELGAHLPGHGRLGERGRSEVGHHQHADQHQQRDDQASQSDLRARRPAVCRVATVDGRARPAHGRRPAPARARSAQPAIRAASAASVPVSPCPYPARSTAARARPTRRPAPAGARRRSRGRRRSAPAAAGSARCRRPPPPGTAAPTAHGRSSRTPSSRPIGPAVRLLQHPVHRGASAGSPGSTSGPGR